MHTKDPNADFNAGVIGSVVLWGIGLWYAVTRQARFTLGGDDLSNRHAFPVDARGLNAIAIGCFFIALGILNLAQAIHGPRRIPVFWGGAGLLGATVLYAVVHFFA